MPDERIYIGDLRAAGKCVSGVRAWFAVNNLDFAKFLREGISEADLLATGDALAREAVDRKHRNG